MRGHQERPLPCGVSPCALCPVFPALKVPSKEKSYPAEFQVIHLLQAGSTMPRAGLGGRF